MPLYEEQIRGAIGSQNVDTFLGACGSDTVTSDSLLEIAAKISPDLRGTIKRKIQDEGYKGRATGWHFLACWYQEVLGMNIQVLIEALKSKDVKLVALAEEMTSTNEDQTNQAQGVELGKEGEPRSFSLDEQKSRFQKMTGVIVEEMTKICCRKPTYEEVFAKDLGVGDEYKMWAQNPSNMQKDMEQRVDFILETWEDCEGEIATPETMYARMDNLSKNNNRKFYKKMAERMAWAKS